MEAFAKGLQLHVHDSPAVGRVVNLRGVQSLKPSSSLRASEIQTLRNGVHATDRNHVSSAAVAGMLSAGFATCAVMKNRSRRGRKTRLFAAPDVIGLKGQPLKAVLKIVCDCAAAEYAIYWEKLGKGFVLAGEFEDPEAIAKRKRKDGSTFAKACSLLEVGEGSIIGKCFKSKEPIFVQNASTNATFTRAALSKEYGVNSIYFFPFEKGVLEVGDEDALTSAPTIAPIPKKEIKAAFEQFGCSSVSLWSKKPTGDYGVAGWFITAERAKALEKQRGDTLSFASESAKFTVGANSAVAKVAQTGKEFVMKNAATDPNFTRRDLAKQFGLTRIRIVPCDAGALEYGVPKDVPLADNTLDALMQMRCDTVNACYAIYWQARDGKDGDEFTAQGVYNSAKSQAKKHSSGQTFAQKSSSAVLGNSSLVGHVYDCGDPAFIQSAGTCKFFTRRDLAKEFDVASVCLEPVSGGVFEYGCNYGWSQPPDAITLPEKEAVNAFTKEDAIYALLWTPKGDQFVVASAFETKANLAKMKAERKDDDSFSKRCASLALGKDSLIANVYRTRMQEAIFDAPGDTMFTRNQLAKEFGVIQIKFVPCTGGVLEYGSSKKKEAKKAAPKKQASGRGRRMALEQAKKAAESATRGFFTPLVDAAKQFLGEDYVLEMRKQIIQGHVKEINKLKLTESDEKAFFAMADTNNDGSVSEQECREALQNIGFVHLQPESIEKIFKKADANRDKKIDVAEFQKRLSPVLRKNFAKLASFRGKRLGLLA